MAIRPIESSEFPRWTIQTRHENFYPEPVLIIPIPPAIEQWIQQQDAKLQEEWSASGDPLIREIQKKIDSLFTKPRSEAVLTWSYFRTLHARSFPTTSVTHLQISDLTLLNLLETDIRTIPVLQKRLRNQTFTRDHLREVKGVDRDKDFQLLLESLEKWEANSHLR